MLEFVQLVPQPGLRIGIGAVDEKLEELDQLREQLNDASALAFQELPLRLQEQKAEDARLAADAVRQGKDMPAPKARQLEDEIELEQKRAEALDSALLAAALELREYLRENASELLRFVDVDEATRKAETAVSKAEAALIAVGRERGKIEFLKRMELGTSKGVLNLADTPTGDAYEGLALLRSYLNPAPLAPPVYGLGSPNNYQPFNQRARGQKLPHGAANASDERAK